MRVRIIRWAIFILALTACAPVTAAIASPLPQGPSFDCAKPSRIEAVVCGDPVLAADDRNLASLYRMALPGVLGSGSDQLDAQRKWLKDLDKQCATGAALSLQEGDLKVCIAGYYKDRLEQVAIADLFTAPQESLAELGQVDPKAAPIYKALLDYASIDDVGRRAETVEAHLAPTYAAMDEETKSKLARGDGKITTLHEVAASDVGFALFFDISAMFNDVRLTWPCVALIKRPGLVDGLGSVWGGAVDNFVPRSDCETTLPPVHAVAALEDSAWKAESPCDGTIRYSEGADYDRMRTAVRLHRTEFWSGDRAPEQGSGDGAKFRRRHARDIAKAKTELAAYYQRYFSVPAGRAAKDADTAIDALTWGAFDLCQ
jgi:uncharacterized protein